ncbi:MAG: hypothetical protein AB7I30_06435 [Isosphaeraceae bacterium]
MPVSISANGRSSARRASPPRTRADDDASRSKTLGPSIREVRLILVGDTSPPSAAGDRTSRSGRDYQVASAQALAGDEPVVYAHLVPVADEPSGST